MLGYPLTLKTTHSTNVRLATDHADHCQYNYRLPTDHLGHTYLHSPTLPCRQANLITSTAYSPSNTVPLALALSSRYHAQSLRGSKVLIDHSISKPLPSGIPYLRTSANLQMYITCTQQWSRPPRSLPSTIPGTAQNSSVPSILPTCTHSVPDLHLFQPGSPLMRLSVTMVAARLLASAKSWFPPLMPRLTHLLTYTTS